MTESHSTRLPRYCVPEIVYKLLNDRLKYINEKGRQTCLNTQADRLRITFCLLYSTNAAP